MQRLWELFDYTDGNLYRKISVGVAKTGSLVGTNLSHGRKYLTVQIDGKHYRVHRVIYFMFYGSFPKVVDHINGDASDNRIENLRAASHSENSWNAKKTKANTSGIKGVSWHKKCSMWRARIKVQYKEINLGFYKSIQQAEQAVKQARLNLHGEFARHN